MGAFNNETFSLSITDLLQKALRSPSSQLIPVMEDLFPSRTEGIAMYNLRTAVPSLKRTYSTWLDQDESGDYDPKADHDARKFKNHREPAAFEPSYRRDCKACTRGRIVCSYRADGDRRRPCNDCVRLHRRCEVPIPRTRRGARPPPSPSPECSTRSKCPPPTPRTVERASKPGHPQPQTFILSTRLAHPIKFNFQPLAEDDQIACHWCDSMVYGILGLGLVHVSVVDGGDSEGYIERENGHTADGHLPSRMCIDCTTRRIRITACRVHGMQELPMMKGAVVDPETQARSLEHGLHDDGSAPPPFDWCSICPNVAYYACGKSDDDTVPDSVPENTDTSSRAEIVDRCGCGCGLRLCADCTFTLVGKHDGDLTRFLTGLLSSDNTPRGLDSNFGFELRADADFLHPDGELMRRARHYLSW
ncbi:hypothetical protein MMC29_000224 [Sticta canariensis]|nr:hypothetical protein [Sticta canariensis]